MTPPHAEGVWKPSGTKNINVQLLQQNQKIIKINLPPPKVNIGPEHDGHDGSEDDIPLPVVHYTSGVYNN